MTPFAQLPEWLDMGPDQDFSAPTANLVDLLKKKMRPKAEGGAGGGLGGILGDDGNAALGKSAMGPEGVKSL